MVEQCIYVVFLILSKMARQSFYWLILFFPGFTVFGQSYQPNPILPDTIPVAIGNTIDLYNDDVAFVHTRR